MLEVVDFKLRGIYLHTLFFFLKYCDNLIHEYLAQAEQNDNMLYDMIYGGG